MEYPTQVVFHNLEPSEYIEQAVHEKTKKIIDLFPNIIHCRVTIESPHHHQQQGQTYQVRILIKVPQDEIVVSQHTGKFGQHEDVYVALRDAFNAAKQKLQNYHEKRKRQIKRHEGMPQGRIVRIFHQQGFGFVETIDGREVYFDQNSVVDADFDKLNIGHKVRLAIEEGEEGPQASTIYAAGKSRKSSASELS